MESFDHISVDCLCEGKMCTKCTEVKCIGAFHRHSSAVDGLQSHCKVCRSLHRKQVNANLTPEQKRRRSESSQSYHRSHREQCLAGMRKRYQENADYHRAYAREHMKEYQAANREKIHAYKRAYYRRNADVIKQKSRKNYHANPQKYMETGRRWIRNNYERHLISRRPSYSLRRTRKTLAGGSFTPQEWEDLKAQYDFTCLCCLRSEPEIKLTADHVKPVVMGGTSNIDNIQPLCKSCNSRKHTKFIDYRRR
jgi:5-methylcytosine-specific restriction endonuclease McrA